MQTITPAFFSSLDARNQLLLVSTLIDVIGGPSQPLRQAAQGCVKALPVAAETITALLATPATAGTALPHKGQEDGEPPATPARKSARRAKKATPTVAATGTVGAPSVRRLITILELLLYKENISHPEELVKPIFALVTWIMENAHVEGSSAFWKFISHTQ